MSSGIDGGANGHVPDPAALADEVALGDEAAAEEEAALDELDAEPLDPSEAATGAAIADEPADETLDERVEAVIDELGDVSRARDREGVTYLAGGRPFAALGEDRLEAALDPFVAKAALRTADTAVSSRGAGWIVFRPRALDRFALDRAEAWVRSAHRRVTGR